MTEALSIAVRYDEDDVVFVVSGDLDMGSAPALSHFVEQAEPTGRPLIFDIGQLGFVDSSGLAVLLLAQAHTEHGVEVRNASDFHRRLLEIAGLTEVLRVS